MSYMFQNCAALTSIPLLDTSNVTDMGIMFYGCTNLTTVPALDANKVTYANNLKSMFYGCSNLKSILMTNIGVNLDISASTKFEREDLLVILNNLKTVTSSKKLTMGATNLAKLTEEDKAIATNKG
jgi:surface protein